MKNGKQKIKLNDFLNQAIKEVENAGVYFSEKVNLELKKIPDNISKVTDGSVGIELRDLLLDISVTTGLVISNIKRFQDLQGNFPEALKKLEASLSKYKKNFEL